MQLRSVLCLALLALLAGGASAADFSKLVFSDDFDVFDMKTWKHEITMGGGGNWEFELYLNNRSNSYVKDGVLYIKPTLTADTIGGQNLVSGYTYDVWGMEPASLCTSNQWYGCIRTSGDGGNVLPPAHSARVRTAESFSFKYGKVEIRAKLPRGDWLWPALWMMPRDNIYGEWPASGEIDMVESRGNQNYAAGGINQMASTLHWGPHWPLDPFQKTRVTHDLPSGDFADDFHVFGLWWDETRIYTYLDDPSNIILDVPMTQSFWERGGWTNSAYDNPWQGSTNNIAPFDQEFFIIFCLAVGGQGGYWADGVGGKPWTDSDVHAVNAFWNAKDTWYSTWKGDDCALQIDYIRVWQDPTTCDNC